MLINSSLVVLANYATSMSIIIEMHFITLPSHNTHVVLPYFLLKFLVNYANMGFKMLDIVLINYVKFANLHVLPNVNSFICEY